MEALAAVTLGSGGTVPPAAVPGGLIPGYRVFVVSASMGAGHDAVAAELARRLTAAGATVRLVDLLALPGTGDAGLHLRRTYELMLRRMPWSYELSMRVWARAPSLMGAIAGRRTACFDRPLAAELTAFEPDAIVSTYNLASQCAGRVKRTFGIRGRLVTYVTDPGAHPYWVDPAAEVHLAVTRQTAADLARLGAGGCVAVLPVVGQARAAGANLRAEVRAQLGLDPNERVALVNAGSWGVGGVLQTVEVLARCQAVKVVLLCGHSEALREQASAWPWVLPLGWVDDMAGLFAAADVLVDNAGGLTCLEALSVGLPVVLFHTLPGHGRLNAETLSRAGLATYATSERALVEGVLRAEPPAEPFANAADPVTKILAAAAASRAAG